MNTEIQKQYWLFFILNNKNQHSVTIAMQKYLKNPIMISLFKEEGKFSL